MDNKVKKEIQTLIDTSITKANLKLTKDIQIMIDKSITKLTVDRLSFRSRKPTDTPTDKKITATKSYASSTYLPLTGGTINGDLIVQTLKVVSNIGFFNTAEQVKQTITGSKATNVALASLITALSTYGLVIDSTT